MATASKHPAVTPPFADTGGGPNSRRIQTWMDPLNEHGQIEVLQLCTADDATPLPKNPFTIGKTIERAVGKIAEAYTEAKGSKYVIKVRNHDQFVRLQDVQELINGTKIKIAPHPSLNVVKCWARCSDAVELDEDQLLAELHPQGVIAVRRITKFVNGRKQNTRSLILTFNGTVAPKHVFFGLIRVETEKYYPLPLICYNCFSFGHAKAKCDAEAACRNCSKNHTSTEGAACSSPAFCKNCNQNHPPSSKTCPVYLHETEIIKLKVDCGMTYNDAKLEIEKRSGAGSYASQVQARLAKARDESEKDNEIKKLRVEVAQMKTILEAYTKLKTQNDQMKRKLQELCRNKPKDKNKPNPQLPEDQSNSTFKNQQTTKEAKQQHEKQHQQTQNKKKRPLKPSLSNEAEGSSQPPGKKLGVEEANKPETMEIDINNIYEILEIISGDEVLDDTADADDEEDNV